MSEELERAKRLLEEAPPHRISGVRSRVVNLPVRQPIRTAIHDSASIDHVLVCVDTAAGLHGIGHLFAFGAARAEILRAMVQDLGERMLGRDVMDTGLFAAMWNDVTFLGHSGVALMAISALDCASWDIRGKALGLPLWGLFGGSSKAISCYSSDGLWLGDPIEGLAEQARERVSAGYRALKVRLGTNDPAADERRISVTRDAVGDRIELMADANQGWSVSQAIETGRRLDRYRLRWLEEPVDADDLRGLTEVSREVNSPIAAGESWYGLLQTIPGLDTGAVSVLMPDLQRIGGITGWMEAAAAGHRRRVEVSPHLFPEVSVSMMCALPGDGLIEYVPWFADLFNDAPVADGGRLRPSDRPGLGFDFITRLTP